MSQSEQIDLLSAALSKAQASMKPAILNKVNPHFKNRYADLTAVIDAIRKPLADNGLALTQTTQTDPDRFMLVTTMLHTSGQWLRSEYPLPMAANPQQIGSALTYARRYSLSSIACIAADEDDDAELASKKSNGQALMPDQVAALQKMLKDKPAINEKSFCNYLGLSELADMSASRYNEAVAAIIEKRKQMEGGA